MKESIKSGLKTFFNLKIRLWVLLLVCVICAGAAAGTVFYKERSRIGGSDNYNAAMKYLEVKNVIDKYYVGDADDESVTDAALYAMVKGLGDKWSYYMSASEYESYQLYSANEYAGIGVTIQVDDSTGGFMVTGVTADSPAQSSGVAVGDIILAVDGTSVTGMTVSNVRTLITEHIDESVTVTLKRASGGTEDVNIDCRVIYTDPVSYEMLDNKVGYIKISNFESGAGTNAISAIDSLLAQGATTLVFDVRSNPGGLLSELIKLLDYILPEGEIFVSVDENGNETVTKSDNVCIDVPMAVLVNSDSYSAAEFFAAALSEYDWAKVVGEKTTGKSRSQITVELSDGSAVHISSKCYLTPNRVDLAAQGGLTPDLVVAASEKEGEDAQLDAAVSSVLTQLAAG